ncbi:hypothetical protein [Sphingomonas beigongshangi]|uniref:hypothetical protein n=1 Tax=Sphingomonas beigongshangi TaxID=2782540 RepID=UPI001AEE01F5|nr:hypothetical protein [Sphingomonas beigongshangi]
MTRAEEARRALDKHVVSELPLPETPDGKVNVNGLCRVLGLTPVQNYAQHFYRDDKLKGAVNTAAIAQGLQPIGARVGDVDDALLGKLAQAHQRASEDARAAVEERAAHEAIYEEVVELRRQLARVTLERDGAVARLRLFEEGGLPPDV